MDRITTRLREVRQLDKTTLVCGQCFLVVCQCELEKITAEDAEQELLWWLDINDMGRQPA